MEIDENNQNQPIQDFPAAQIIQQNAPIAEPEILPLNEEIGNNEEAIQLGPSPSSLPAVAESIITAKNGNQPKLGMIRLRRKRRLDPFGNLILSTKKMKLNDTTTGNGQEGQNDGQKGQEQQQGSVEFGDDDELVFYYGGEDDEDDSADGYDDEDADSNAENYYKNDYPDEDEGGGGNEFENESTSDDDYFGLI